jgi:hypothetical protein
MKIPFEVVETQIETMFANALKEDEQLTDRLIAIEEFIESCGWDIDEYETYREFGVLN